MKKTILILSTLIAATALTACTRQDEGLVAGGVGGAALGSVITGGSGLGTAVGAVGGAFVGSSLAR